MTHAVTLRHNMEAGHRLPHLAGRCVSLHGHSWWVEVTIESPALDGRGTVVEFGAYKAGLRGWIDHHLDHGLMLGHGDELADLLRPHGKVFTFGETRALGSAHGEVFAVDLPYPTVENVAVLLSRVAMFLLDDYPHAAGARVVRVDVSETHVNKASWTPAAMA